MGAANVTTVVTWSLNGAWAAMFWASIPPWLNPTSMIRVASSRAAVMAASCPSFSSRR